MPKTQNTQNTQNTHKTQKSIAKNKELKVAIGGKTFGDNMALQSVGFEVKHNEFLCLVGPSGCGKSTLLNIIANLILPDSGSISYARKKPLISYVFQDPRLMPWLTVEENILLVTSKTAENKKIARELLASMRLEKYANSYPSQISGGMRRRVSLARAFVIRPDLLLLDEPFVSLDRPLAESLMRLLQQLLKNHPATTIFVSHNLEESVSLGSRILFFSASPAKIILDMKIPKNSSTLAKTILKKHPQILEGKI